MNSDYDRVMALIDRIYGAATDDTQWPEILGDFRALFDCDASTLLFTDNNLKPHDKLFGSNVASEAISSYRDHFHTVDIRLHRSIPQCLGKIMTDGDIVDDSIINGHEFYQDFLRPIGHRYIISAIMDLGDGTFAFASCHRGLNQDHADREAIDRAGLLMPHLLRGLQLRRRLGMTEAREQAALDVLNWFRYAVFLIDRLGRIVWQNAMGDHLLGQRDGLMTGDGELRTESPKTTTELNVLIRSAIDAIEHPQAAPGGLMTIARPSLLRAYQVLVTPLPKEPSLNFAANASDHVPVAAAFVTDPEISSVPRAQTIAKLYHLTPAEAKLATALASGTSIKSYAEKEERSVHYVRWLLKQVEAKTDTRRIADLIRLLTSQTGFQGNDDDDFE